jgi:hypothetical protein
VHCAGPSRLTQTNAGLGGLKDHAQPMRPRDVRLENLDAAEAEVLELWAKPLQGGGANFRLFADPAGHPFWLVAF